MPLRSAPTIAARDDGHPADCFLCPPVYPHRNRHWYETSASAARDSVGYHHACWTCAAMGDNLTPHPVASEDRMVWAGRRDDYTGPCNNLQSDCGIDYCIQPNCQAVECGTCSGCAGAHRCTQCGQTECSVTFTERSNGNPSSWCRDCTARRQRERRQRIRDSRPPTTPYERAFGVEIETNSAGNDSSGYGRDFEDLARELRALGLNVQEESYNHTAHFDGVWKIISDASVDGPELVSPVLRGAEGRADVRRMMMALQTLGVSINSSCGMHVHHDATDGTPGRLLNLARMWQRDQGLTDQLVSASRRAGGARSSEWCRRLSAHDLETLTTVTSRFGPDYRLSRDDRRSWYGRLERYRTLNLQALAVHGTVEIRQHQGTLNPGKALAWVMFGQAMLHRAFYGPAFAVEGPTTVAELIAELESTSDLEPAVGAYLVNRVDQLCVGAREVA